MATEPQAAENKKQRVPSAPQIQIPVLEAAAADFVKQRSAPCTSQDSVGVLMVPNWEIYRISLKYTQLILVGMGFRRQLCSRTLLQSRNVEGHAEEDEEP